MAISKGNFDKIIHVSKEPIKDILWWKHNFIGAYALIVRKKPSVVINTDLNGEIIQMGASLGQNKTGGQFSTEESQQHINILELKAARFSLKALFKNEFNSYILTQIDNRSDISAINKMGSVKSIEVDNEVHPIWEFISTQNNLLTATHPRSIQKGC